MYSVGSFVIGCAVDGVWVWFWSVRGSGPADIHAELLLWLMVIGVSVVGSGAGLVLAATGLYLRQARRWALAGIALNLVPWCIIGTVWLLG